MDISVVGDEIVANPHPIGVEGNGAADDANGERPLKKVRREDGEGGAEDETEDVIEVDDEEDPLDDADEEDSAEDDEVEEDDPEVEEHEAPEREEGHASGFLNEALELKNAVPQGLSSSMYNTKLQPAELFLYAAGSD